jgi:hypothetical protein
MSHIGSAMDQHMFSIPTLRPYSAIGVANVPNSMSTTPAPSFLHPASVAVVSGSGILDQERANGVLNTTNFDQIDRSIPTNSASSQLHSMHHLQRIQRNVYSPLLGAPVCDPGGLCSAPFSEEELSRPLPRADLPIASGYGMAMAHHLGRSLPLLLDHNNNRLSIDRSNPTQPIASPHLSQATQAQPSLASHSQLSTGLAPSKSQQVLSPDSPLPPPLPPPPLPAQSSQPTSRPTSRRASFHQPRPLSPSTFSESSSCTPASGKKIGFRVGSPPPEMHFKRWTLPRNLHQQRLQRQQQHWQRLHFAELQQQRAQRAAALDDNQPRPTSARSRTPTFSKRPLVARQPTNGKSKRSTATTNAKSFGSHPQLPPSPDPMDYESQGADPDRLLKWQRFQQFLQSAAPPFLFSAPPPLPTSYAKYLYETATHKYYTIPGKRTATLLPSIVY